MIKFDGESLRQALSGTVEKLGEAVGQEAMRAAGFAGAEVFRDEAKANAQKNRKTGVLMNNIIVKRLEEVASDRKQAYIVTVRTGKFGADGDAFYWRFVEFGHSFVRRSKKGQSLKAARKASELEYGTSTVAAQPFMRPAYESKKQEAIDAMQAMLAKKVQQKLGGS